MPYNCTNIWPLPKSYPFIHAFANANNRIASFEVDTMTSRMAFLQDHNIKGQKLAVFSALLEMVQEALNVLFATSSRGIHILKSVVLGTIEDSKGSYDTIRCSIDTVLGLTSIVDACGNHLSAETARCMVAASNMIKDCAPFSKLLIRASTYMVIRSPWNGHFAKAIARRDALDFIVHPGLVQSSLTLHHLALAAHRQCAAMSFVSCATIAMKNARTERSCIDVPSDVSMCEHLCQNLKCTDLHGQTFLQFSRMQMRLEDEPLRCTSDLPTLSLEWQPLAISIATHNTFKHARPLRWVILSEIPCKIGELCCVIDLPVIATTIMLSGCGHACRNRSEMHIDNEEDLVHFLSTVKADSCLLVQGPHGMDCCKEISSSESAMLWVFRAYARAPTTFKMHLVTRRERKCDTPPGLTLCQGRKVYANNFVWWHMGTCGR